MIGKAVLAAAAAVALASSALAAGTSATAPAVRPARLQPLTATPAPAASSSPAPAGADVHPLEAADLSAWLDGYVPYALKSGDIAGAVVVVVKDGQVLLQKGYGLANVAAKTPMDPARTLIRPGSTSKLFTWTAVMQQVQQGRLDLDVDVNRYLDFKLPEPKGPITLRDLMNHRGGFEEGLKDIFTYDPRHLVSNEAYLKTHLRPMLFAPGEAPAYSNYGASLAGYIVQRVSGESFAQYVARHEFQPLGMAHSTFEQPLPAALRPDMAVGYRQASGPPGGFELVATTAAGSMTTTASDMARFMLAQLGGGRLGDAAILDPAIAHRMQSPSERSLPGFDVMAHGFFYGRRNGRVLIGHGGDTIAFHSELDLLPGENVGIFYSFNSRGKADAVYGARQGLLDGFLDRYFPAPAAAAAPTLASAPRDAGEIAGRYQSSRRVEHGFLSALYLLSQSTIQAHPDGLITAPGGPTGAPATFREVAPQVWRRLDGPQELALVRVKGVKTVLDSENPVTVLQPVPFARSAPLNVSVLLASTLVLVWAAVLGPLSALLLRGERASRNLAAGVRRWRWVERGAAVFALLYLFGWLQVVQPVLSNHLEVYSASAFDPTVRAMQVAGVLMLAAAALGAWSAWRITRSDATALSKLWSWTVAAALCGVVWIAAIGGLLSWSLNY